MTAEVLTTSRQGEIANIANIDSDGVAELVFADGTVGYFDENEYQEI